MTNRSLGVLENNGAVVFAPAQDPGTTYPRILTLRHNGNNNGRMLLSFDFTGFVGGQQVWPIYQSDDGGATWAHISDVRDETLGFTKKMDPMMFEVPAQIGGVPEGTLFFTGVLKPDDESTTNIVIFRSDDLGMTWYHWSTVDAGGPAVYDPSQTSTTTAIWEPFLALDANGDLVIYYSDERQKSAGILQALVQRISADGGLTWGNLTNVVGVNNQSDRPGMITLTTLPDGTRFITYEVVNRPSLSHDSAQVYCKSSPDGITWDSQTIGSPVLLADGSGLGSAPYVKWVDNDTANGLIVVGSKWALDADGNLMEGQNFYTNGNLGQGSWGKMPMAVTFDSLDDSAYLTGMSQSLETDLEGKTLYQAVNVQNAVTKLNDIRVGALPILADNYEAESATLTDIALVDHYDASNGQKVGNINFPDSSVLFNNINVSAAGDYMLNVRYDNGFGTTCIQNLSVNDGAPQQIEFAPTKDWGRYAWKSIPITLNAGTNTISFGFNTDFTELDCIQIYKL